MRSLLTVLVVLGACAPRDRDGDGVLDMVDVFWDDPSEWADQDGDGMGDNADCDDDDADPEVSEPLSGFIDEDDDGFGAGLRESFCATSLPEGYVAIDGNERISPEAEDVPYDGIDQDCDGDDVWDVDGDGFTPIGAPVGSADDCNDDVPGVNPMVADTPGNEVDEDCDGDAFDHDGDGDDDVLGLAFSVGFVTGLTGTLG